MEYEKLATCKSGLFTKLLEQKDSFHSLNKRHYQEGLNKGFTLLSEQPLVKEGKSDYNYKLYICNKCGSVDYFQPHVMRRINSKCSNCFMNSIKESANLAGLDLVLHQPEPLPTIFRRKECGHIVKHRRHYVKQIINRVAESARCKSCYDDKITKHLQQKGLKEMKPPLNPKGKAEFLVKSCGHTIKSTYSNLLISTPQCSDCLVDNFKKDVESHGLKYLGKSVASATKGHHTYELPCGHVKSIRLDKARMNAWECRECEVSHLDKPSFLYLLYFRTEGLEWLKLGYARNIENRVSSYGVGNTPYTVEYIQKFQTGQEVKDFEIELHKTLRDKKIPKTTMKNFHKNNGGNECYPVSEIKPIVKLIQERLKN